MPGDPAWRKPALLGFYILLMIYAFFPFPFVLSPGSLTDVSQVVKAVSGPQLECNPIFRALFSLLLPVGIGMFALLSAGAPAQRWLSVNLFGILGALLGFYGSGFYISLREYAPKTRRGDLARESYLVRAMESPFVALFVLGYSLQSYLRLFPLEGPGAIGFRQSYTAFLELVKSDRYVWASSVDIVVLTVVGYGVLVEDMRRRGWMFDGPNGMRNRATAVSIMSVPGLGIGAYLLFRGEIGEHS